MGADSKIEWTDATWNPLRGCSRVSEGCRNCYAERIAARFNRPGDPYYGLAHRMRTGPRWSGLVHFAETALREPLSWRRPRRVFVNSMSDLFHEKVPDEWLDRIFAVMAVCPRHTFQILTKRAARMRDYVGRVYDERHDLTVKRFAPHITWWPKGWPGFAWPLPNVWLGVSAENQETADERIPDLLATPARVRFVSCEPLLERVDLKRGYWLTAKEGHIDWVIVGGESGPGARPMDLSWAYSILEQCHQARVPCFVKQLGADPRGGAAFPAFKRWGAWGKGGDMEKWPLGLRVRKFPPLPQHQEVKS